MFGRVLRRAGLEVHHGRLIDAIRSLEWVGVARRDDVRATLRALLVHRHDDLARFDTLFDEFFHSHDLSSTDRQLSSPSERPRVVARRLAGAPPSVDLEDDAGDSRDGTTLTVGAYSASGVSHTKDFADFSAAELETARRLLSELPWTLGARTTRRWQARQGNVVDLRPILRRVLTRGEVIELPRRRRREAPRPIIVIGDVSGSMERYSRMILHFAEGLSIGARQVESFVFATRLTRITRSLATAGSAQHLSRVIRDISDWGGGTRIGDALRSFNTDWARRVMRNGPVVLLVSDGWDRGDPATLARELARLRRGCRRLIWLNPLLGSATYEPLTRGMQAALGHIDDFLPVHNLASLEDLSRHLQRLPSSRRSRVAVRALTPSRRGEVR
jgi:uncharacterized protein with von Willebrand factor type A (vWA) domain